ncbi:hypothetical protein GCM10010149_47590 [Nonomuraea roseoviolacea subsp. roseoviolacea]|uniref:hypothetical protein n=1 Tax=Nonomuraea roseoviolacea TaxID=103837 RepID=UPI0031CFD833
MAERSFPFDGGSGSIITETDWSMLAQNWQDSGVVANDPSDTALKVTTLNEPGKVYVQPGQATIRGFHYVNESPLTLTVPTNTDANYSRIDLVVVGLDKATNRVRAYLKVGTPASTPVPPAVDRSFDTPEVPLAQLTVAAGSSSVPNTAGAVADVREYIGKRVRITNSPGTLPLGSLAYRPSDDKFYGVGTAGATALGSGGSGTPGGGGLTVCTSTTRPPSPTTGQQIYETDTYRQLFWTGTAWQQIAVAPYAVRRENGSQAISLDTAVTVKYDLDFKTIPYSIVPAGGTAWANTTKVTSLPPAALPVESLWAATFSCQIFAPVNGVVYDFLITDTVSETRQSYPSTGTSAAYVALTAQIRVPAGIRRDLYVQIVRVGGSAHSVTLQYLTLNLTRIG